MGLIVDSTYLISAERRGSTVRDMLLKLQVHAAGSEVAVSVVSLSELAQGVARADTISRKSHRQAFIDEVMLSLVAYPVSAAIAVRAGTIAGISATREYILLWPTSTSPRPRWTSDMTLLQPIFATFSRFQAFP